MKETGKVQPTLSLQGKWNAINIGVGVVAALGNPTHICILKNLQEYTLAIAACNGKDVMSFRVPESRLFKIHSKQFVTETLMECGLDREKTYLFKGEYLEEQKIVIFHLKEKEYSKTS